MGGFQMKLCVCWIVLGFVCAGQAWAAPTVDGNASAGDGYGAALSVQNTNTQFGESIYGDPVNGGPGSEIDQVFGTVQNGRLYVTVSGNLQMNFNKMVVFVDSKAGGVNTINGAALPAGVDAFCCGGFGTTDGALQRLNGLQFDAGFNADYMLAFTHGQENVSANTPNADSFWALTAHYADLTQGTNGAVVSAGMQLAPRGLPNVMRAPGDFNHDGAIDAGDYVMYRKLAGQTVPKGTVADANGDGVINDADFNIWRSQHGTNTTLGDYSWVPNDPSSGASNGLIGPALPGLAQGQLIDRNYAITSGGCNADDSGSGCAAKELAFALNVDPLDVGNTNNHRNFNNSIGLQMALDNSNTAGVTGDGPYGTPTTGNPQNVTSGLEFSIPLSQIGTTAGGGPIKLTIFVTSEDYDYLSNQFAGDGLLFGNYGAPPMNLDADFPGNQYVTVPNPGSGAGVSAVGVPEPGAIGLLCVGAAAIGCGRRRG
jgi:hypothetical protein